MRRQFADDRERVVTLRKRRSVMCPKCKMLYPPREVKGVCWWVCDCGAKMANVTVSTRACDLASILYVAHSAEEPEQTLYDAVILLEQGAAPGRVVSAVQQTLYSACPDCETVSPAWAKQCKGCGTAFAPHEPKVRP